jgi:hypothetical protein
MSDKDPNAYATEAAQGVSFLPNVMIIDPKGSNDKFVNYWDSSLQKDGFCFLVWNGRGVQLQVPDAMRSMMEEWSAASSVFLSFGRSKRHNRDLVEVVFEDHSSSPYVLLMGDFQCAILSERREGMKLTLMLCDRNGVKYRLPGRYRTTFWTSKL